MVCLGNKTIPSKSIAADVYALQKALQFDGDYPPVGKTMTDCPRSGIFGACTRDALTTFQNKHGITGEDGIVGNKTLKVLNAKF